MRGVRGEAVREVVEFNRRLAAQRRQQHSSFYDRQTQVGTSCPALRAASLDVYMDMEEMWPPRVCSVSLPHCLFGLACFFHRRYPSASLQYMRAIREVIIILCICTCMCIYMYFHSRQCLMGEYCLAWTLNL